MGMTETQTDNSNTAQLIISVTAVRTRGSEGIKEQVFNVVWDGAKGGFAEKIMLELGLGGWLEVCLIDQEK